MALPKITSQDTNGKGVIGLPDAPGLASGDMQKKFDELALEVIVPKFNEMVDVANDTMVTHTKDTAVGSTTQPTYVDANGEVKPTTYTVAKSVPSNAKFTDTTYSNATTSAAGLMSSADKTKLDGIAAGANAYSLPTASASTKGGIKVGANLSMNGDVLSATNTTYSTATQSANGLMSANDKKKLDGIASGATAVTSATVSGWGFKTTDTTYSNATQQRSGLMSNTDKAKLDGIASGANAYSLPAASSGALGGIKVSLSGTTLYISTT